MSLLKSKIGKVEFPTPLMAASGTWNHGLEFLGHPLQKFLGTFVTRSLSLESSEIEFSKSSAPRLVETNAGILHSLGHMNGSIDAFLKEIEPSLKAAKSRFVLSIVGKTSDEIRKLVEKAHQTSAVAIEMNISSQLVSEALKISKKISKKPIWIKLGFAENIIDSALAAEAAGADALVMIQSIPATSIYIETPRPTAMQGGLSGPAIRPLAVESVFRCAQRVKIPIIGVGGIHCAEDIIEFLSAGASAVQIGSWNFRDPFCYEKFSKEIEAYLRRQNFKSIQDLIGLSHRI